MTTASDAFNRANETPVSTPWATVTPLGGLNLSANALTGVTDVARASLYNSGTWGDDQRVDVTVSNLLGGTRYAEAWVRGSTGGNGYKVYTDGTTGGTAIARMDAGAETTLQAVAVAFSASDVLGIGIVGTTITLYKNGVAQTPTTTDATYSSGLPGAGTYGLAIVDDWTANDGGGGDATVTGQTITVTGSVIPGSASATSPDATVNGQTLTANVSLIRRAVEQYVPEDLFIFGDTDSNESSMGGQKLFGGYPASGASNATVNGQTITVNGSIIPGTATGEQNATVNGQTLTVTGSVIAGTASASSNATVNGQTITVNGSVIAGSVSADSSVAGQTITVNASVIPGSATGTGDASVAGQTITVNGSVIAGSASGSSNATVNGQTLAVTASLIAGAASGQSNATVAGQTLTVAASLIAGGVAVDSVAAGTVINIAASIIAGSASAPANATVSGQTIVINGSTISGAAFGPSAGGQRWRSIGMHLGLRL